MPPFSPKDVALSLSGTARTALTTPKILSMIPNEHANCGGLYPKNRIRNGVHFEQKNRSLTFAAPGRGEMEEERHHENRTLHCYSHLASNERCHSRRCGQFFDDLDFDYREVKSHLRQVMQHKRHICTLCMLLPRCRVVYKALSCKSPLRHPDW